MKRSALACLLMVVLVVTGGCGGGSLGSKGGRDQRIVLTKSDAAGAVTLPVGYPLAASALRATTAISDTSVGADGSFTTKVYNEGVQLCTVLGPNGKIAMFGWIGGGHTTISARSTAEVYLYFALGVYGHQEAVRLAAIAAIAERPETATVEAAIASALASDPEAIGNGATAVTDAVKAAVASMLGDSGAQSQSEAKRGGRGMLIDPSDTRSGITPIQDGSTTLKVINSYRRRCWAFIERVSYVPAAGGDAVPSPAKVTDFEIGPTSGTSGLVGTFADIVSGTSAYAQTSTGPFTVPRTPSDAQKTTYKLMVVGLGAWPGDEAQMTADHSRAWKFVVTKQIIRDFLLPIGLNIVMGLKGSQIDRALESYIGATVLGDFINTLMVSAPDIYTKAASGDMEGAMWDALTAVRTSGTLRAFWFELCRMVFTDYMEGQAFMGYTEKFMAVLTLGDIILTSIDSYVQCQHVALSSRADSWDITVNGSKAKLTPPAAHIMADETASFHASLPDVTGGTDQPVLAYHWKCAGTAGRLKDGMHTGTEFDSSSADVTFEATGNRAGTDTITVEIFERKGGQSVSQGTATSTVGVKDRSKAPVVLPRKVSVFPSDTQTFTAQVDYQAAGGANITYVWSTSGNYGLFKGGVKQMETQSRTVDYQALISVEGTDTVRCEAFLTKDGKRESLGASTATAIVEKRRSIVMGRFTVEGKELGNGRFSIGAYVIVPKIDGASSYAVRGYNFYDWAYYGESLSLSIPPVPEDRGSEYWAFISGMWGGGAVDQGAMDWYRRRFAGMVVECTVTYSD